MDYLLSFSALTLILLGLIVLMTIWFVGPGYSAHSASHSPTILTSTGIFGTFLGVALGLMNFDTSDIQASVPDLIGGLQTAFWTSIAGLLGALIIKFRHLHSVVRLRKVEAQYEAATVDDLASLLGAIRDSLSNPDAGGLLSAIAELRREQHQGLQHLQSALERYQADMTEANTQAFITAIESVMRDFNTQINTQYGENFKELNEAVGNMLLWQQNYKVELQELLVTQKSNGKLLDKAANAYEKVVTHSEIFNTVSESMGKMMEGLKSQSKDLDTYLSRLATVAEQAAAGLPSLEGRVDALTSQLADSVTRNQVQLSQVLEDASRALRDTSAEVNRNLSESLNLSQEGLRERVDLMVERTGQQVELLDKALETELTKALTTFGYQLTSLSEKFVNDYAPLTDKLRDLVHLVEQTAPVKQTDERQAKPKQRTRVTSD